MKYNIKKLFDLYNITDIATDSRKVVVGSAFFAIRGNNYNGNDYIKDAIAKGASLVFSESTRHHSGLDPESRESSTKILNQVQDDIPCSSFKQNIYLVDNIKDYLTQAVQILYPNLPNYLVAVTGTNGKTSVVSYARQLFAFAGKKAASIGTLGVICSDPAITKYFDREEYQNLTTLDQVSIYKVLDYLARAGVHHVALEASSHGLDQDRLRGINFKAAGFISFSHDHLDYHNNMANYLAAKLKLFSENLQANGIAVINKQISEFLAIREYLSKHNKKILTLGEDGDIRINNILSTINGQEVTIMQDNKSKYKFTTDIIGEFQIYNILMAIVLVTACDIEVGNIVKYSSKLKTPAGRLERAGDVAGPYQVFIDYAHTPQALSKALTELRKVLYQSSSLKVVFGCGGNRDKSKRKIMGQIAQELADEVIITDDNPRNEDPAAIRNQIMEGAPKASVIADRKHAIESVILSLQNRDILLIAGKGHENYQIIGNNKIPFSDIEIARKSIAHKKEDENTDDME